MKKIKVSTKILKIISIMLMAIMLTACGKKKIDVMGTLSLDYKGVDGYGTPELVNAYGWEQSAYEAAGIESIETIDALGDVFIIGSAVSYEIYPKENLSNGDEVTVKATVNNEVAENYKIEFVTSEKKFIVDGLKEVKAVDLFEYVDVTYSGIAPYIKASVNYTNTDSYVQTSYSIDKKDYLKIGDVIIVSANYNKEDLLTAGYKAENDTKEFVVPASDQYIMKLDDISDDLMVKMKRQQEDAFNAQVASKWKETDSVQEISYAGSYMLTLKSSMVENTYLPYNAVYIIYKIDVSNSENDFSFYTYCRFEDIIMLKDGTCSVDLSKYSLPTGTAFFGSTTGEAFYKGSYYYLGYEELDSLFNNCVTKNIESYDYEVSIKEQ